jgi:pimeloyl-ACP methyl ester carboxylesterase
MLRRFVLPLLACTVLLTSARLYADTAVAGQKFDSNGVKVYYTIEGKGTPVLLIHGFGANGDLNWRAPGVVKALAEHYQVITIDNRGHGRSDKPHDPAKYGEEMVEDAVRLLDHLGIKKAHVVGYSMGGMITAKLLTTHPDRLLSATLGGHGGVKQGDDMGRMEPLTQSLEAGKGIMPLLIALNPPGKPIDQKQLEETNKRFSAFNDQQALAAVVKSWRGMLVTDEKLKANKVPTLALIGDQDPLKKGVDALEGRLANVQIVVIKDANHMDAMRKDQFIDELKRFLAAHSASVSVDKNRFKKSVPAIPASKE